MNFSRVLLLVIVGSWSLVRKVSATNRCDVYRHVRYRSRCEECSINERLRCPPPYVHTSSGIGVRGCSLRIYFGSIIGTVTVAGCKHTCDKKELVKECCSGHWGSDCQACPGDPVCSSAGKCFDKVKGNGTCACKDGFRGTACELCTNTTMFGLNCNQTCGCQRGICQNKVNSSGKCKPYSCQIGYTGANCDIRLPACDQSSIRCGAKADCFKINGTDTCLCEPGYSGNGSICLAINPCDGNSHGCHRNANCIYTGPGKHRCECGQGYRGDGMVCVVIDPCQTNNGGCGPDNTTACNFLAPGQSNCTCLPGFVNKTNAAGCTMLDLCDDGNRGGCDVNADCFMSRPGEKRCSCKQGFRGNGTVCYGNIAKRAVQLNTNGPPGVQGLLIYAISIFTHSLARPLADTGPFTVFMAIDAAIGSLSSSQREMLLSNNTDFISHVVRLHVVAADLSIFALNKTKNITTLQGTNAMFSIENGNKYYSLAGSATKARIIASDFLAGNGIIHIVDKVLWYPGNYTLTHTQTLLEIIQRQKKHEQFSRLLELSGVTSYLTGVRGVTLLIPDNSPFLQLDNITLSYLTTTEEGKIKLRSVLKNHIIQSQFGLQVTDLMSLLRVTSIEGESITVQRTPQGAIVFGGKSQILESNILARDGIIHRVSGLLVPDDIQPLLPNYEYTYQNTSAKSVCYRCDTIPGFPNKGCPGGYIPTTKFVSCVFRLSTPRGRYSFKGCKVSDCIKTTKIKDCSRGFYGSTCRPCPGPIGKPCNLHGRCEDKMAGSGMCTCQSSFIGTACERCANSKTFGPWCNDTCTCVHGLCDSGIAGNGTCKPNSCKLGYHGNNCDITDKPCSGLSSRRCHIHAHCVNENGADICKCNPGYEGSGEFCTVIDPCTKPNRGGCHKDASCIMTGPGTNNCTCDRGFRGDGVVCVVVDPCKEGAQLSCHLHAGCRFTGPGQSSCVCKSGYTGSGRDCTEINNCLVNNGGCSPKAKCSRVGPGQHNCTCLYGYIGNGYACLGSVAKVIEDDSRLTSLYKFIKKAHLEYFLSMEEMNFTVFAPSNVALNRLNPGDSVYWSQSTDRLVYLIRHHLANISYSSRTLINLTSLLVMNGLSLNITQKNNVVILNGGARVTQADIGAANGMVHIIDKVLVPQRLPSEPVLSNVSQVLANLKEFSDLNQFLKNTPLASELENCVGCTIFAPVNSALKNFRLVQHKNITLDVLKYHVILKYITPGHYYDGQQFSTKLGQNYLVKLTKPSAGEFAINGIPFDSGIRTKFSIIYKLPQVLEPTKSRCDIYSTIYGQTQCRRCPIQLSCPSPWTKVRTASCYFWGFLRGCMSICKKVRKVPKCCSGFWGPDCQACPGNVKAACFGNGKCSEGIAGNGHCTCNASFTGTACEKCLPKRYGKTCSSTCACVHGRCNEGIGGDGSCKCEHGWKGPRCNTSANYKNCLPVQCNTHATCRESNGRHVCECDFRYIGNGTYCREVHACDIYSGGCHSKATCSPHPDDPSRALCTCKEGYTGDGRFCSGIDLCQTNNGGCHVNATCSSTGPGKRSCHCLKGFLGDGITCKSDNPCLENHGECSLRARCTQTGPGQRNCTCGPNFVGNGVTCIGSSMEILDIDPELSKLKDLYETYKLDKLLQSNTPTSILAPTNKAIKQIQQGRRKRRAISSSPTTEQYLRYHIIGCARITNETSRIGGRFVSLLGAPIWIKNNGSGTFFVDAQNNTARIIQIHESVNGHVFKLDQLLTPPSDVINTGNPSSSYTNVAKSLGYTKGLDLLKLASLENILSNPFRRPYLVFMSTNQAIDRLPERLKTRLSTPAHVDELRTYIKYHMVPNAPANLTTDFFVRGGGGVELTTMQGQTIFVSCKGGKGDLYVNGVSRISKRDIQFKGGVGFAVDDALLPLGLGGNCDQPIKEIINGSCGNCLLPVSCPPETTLVGSINHGCTFNGGILGCQPRCMRHKIERKCCSNFYGSDCRACPGGEGTPCLGRGQCDDGLTGTGVCNCTKPFYGTACERCPNNTGCPAPGSCNENPDTCHVFATCSDESGHVNCTCKPGYEGDGFYCQMRDLCAVNNGDCGVNATCHFQGPDQRLCQCKQGFYKVNDRCQAFGPSSPCSVNHGGCSDHASCTESNGAAVCKCWAGYTGDGIQCHGNLIQSLESTVKVSSFYKVLHHLSVSREGKVLFTDLQTDSKRFTVFTPVDSAVKIKGFNLTMVKNHIVPSKIKLSILSNVTTVTSLLGTKIMIRKAANGDISINGAAHVLTDIQATNGVIFVVDQVVPITGPVPRPASTTSRPTITPTSSTTPTSSKTPPPTKRTSSSTQQTTITSLPSTKRPSTLPKTTATTQHTTNHPTTTTHTTNQPTSNKSSLPTLKSSTQRYTTDKTLTSTSKTTIKKATSGEYTTASILTSSTGVTIEPTTNSTKPGVFGKRAKSHEGLSGGKVAAIVVTLIFVIAVFAGVIWYYRKKVSLPSPSFRYRKENETVQYDSEVFQDNAPSFSYENPMYGDTSESGPREITVHEVPGLQAPFSDPEHTEFSNPIYMELKEPPSKGESSDNVLNLVEDGDLPAGKEQKC